MGKSSLKILDASQPTLFRYVGYKIIIYNLVYLSIKHFKDDFLMGTLTVKENIAFSAALRLSPRYSERDRRQKVDHVIRELGLTHVAESKV